MLESALMLLLLIVVRQWSLVQPVLDSVHWRPHVILLCSRDMTIVESVSAIFEMRQHVSVVSIRWTDETPWVS